MSKIVTQSNVGSGLVALNEQIQANLEKRHLSSFKLCSQLAIPHAQFAEAIKRTNIFPRDPRLFEILSALGIKHDGFTDESSYEKLQGLYAVNFKRRYASRGREEFENLADLLKSNQELPPSVFKSIKEFSAEVEYYFSLFEKDDIFVYIGLNLIPYEMSPGEGIISCAKYIAKAAAKGSFFIYLFPQKQLLEKYLMNGCEIQSFAFEDLFQKVFIPALKEQLSGPAEIDMLERHVLMLAMDDNPFFAIDHKFALYKVRQQIPPVAESYCMGLLPFGKQDNAFILPLNSEFMQKFSQFITWRLQKAAKGQDNISPAPFYAGALEAFRKS